MSDWKYSDLMAQLIAVARREELTDVRNIYAFVDHYAFARSPIGHADSNVFGVICGFARDQNSTGYVFFSRREDPQLDEIEVVEMWDGFEPEQYTALSNDVDATDSIHPDWGIWTSMTDMSGH